MLYIANWTLVTLLLGLWSLAAWAFHGVVVWAVTKAPSLTGPAADLSSVPVPAWLMQFLPSMCAMGLLNLCTAGICWRSMLMAVPRSNLVIVQR